MLQKANLYLSVAEYNAKPEVKIRFENSTNHPFFEDILDVKPDGTFIYAANFSSKNAKTGSYSFSVDAGFSSTGSSFEYIASPLKQFKSGIAPKDVVCKQGLELVMKKSNGQPICIKGTSVETLTLRNYIPEYNGALGGEIPSGSSNSGIIEIPNNSGILLEGLKITYKIDEPIKFTLVLKAGQKCSTTEISIINAHTSEIMSGVLIDPLCNSKYYPQDVKIDIPTEYQNTPITINQPGYYTILVKIDEVFVFENGFLVRSIIPR
jgi:hypothetical protein